MLEKLGKRALVAPLAMALLICCLLGTIMAPMLRAEPHDAAFALVNLDEGAVTIAGSSNVGEALAENLVSGESSLIDADNEADEESSSTSMTMQWTQLDSVEEALAALDDNELYGALVIPENFTSQQMASATGLGDAPEIAVYLNVAKNPQMASILQTTLEAAMLKAGVTVNVEKVNDADVGGGSMASTMMVQMAVMPLFIMSLIGSILTSLVFWKNDVTGLRKKSRALAFLAQVLIVVALSAVIAALALLIDVVAGGMTLPFGELYLFLWPACLCTMLAFVGLCNLALPLGALVAICVFALGTGTAMLAPEMLPAFWADWVCPWAPQAHIGKGIRSIVYLGRFPNVDNLIPLIVFGAVGLVALIAAALIRHDTAPRQAKAAE